MRRINDKWLEGHLLLENYKTDARGTATLGTISANYRANNYIGVTGFIIRSGNNNIREPVSGRIEPDGSVVIYTGVASATYLYACIDFVVFYG